MAKHRCDMPKDCADCALEKEIRKQWRIRPLAANITTSYSFSSKDRRFSLSQFRKAVHACMQKKAEIES